MGFNSRRRIQNIALPQVLNSTLNIPGYFRMDPIIFPPLQHLLKMNKNANLFKLDILPGPNFRGPPRRTRNNLNFDRIHSRYEARLIDWIFRIRFSSLSSRFQSVVSARNNSLTRPMHETRRHRGLDTQEEVRIWQSNGPGLLSVSGGCCYIEAEVFFDIQTRMGGNVEVRNECV